MKTIHYVEISREPFHGKRLLQKTSYRVHKEKDFSVDLLSATMIAVFRVEYARTKEDAIAAVLEFAAGYAPCVTLVYGGRKKEDNQFVGK